MTTHKLNISNSAKDRYETCGYKYKLHDIDGYRGIKIPSALFFGNALDEAFSRLLLDKKKLKTAIELEQLQYTAEDVFYTCMQTYKHPSGDIVDVPHSDLMDYYNSDFDSSLLTPRHLERLKTVAPDVSDYPRFMESCQELFKLKKRLSPEDHSLYNYITWLTLVEKGYLMVEAYRTQVMPHIFEVFDIQKSIEIVNENGDKIRGKIDFKCSFSDDPLTVYTVDNKTSAPSKVYTQDTLAESEQLATYCEAEQDYNAAYIVIYKKVFKKTPKIRTQIIKGKISEEVVQKVFDKYEKVLYSITEEKFEKNWDSCFKFGRMCEFYSVCKHKNWDYVIKVKRG